MTDEDSPKTQRAALRDAQRRLADYGRFGVQMQEQMDAILTGAASAARELERELGEQIQRLRAERDQLLAETAAAQEEIEHHRTQAALFVATVEEQTGEILNSLRRAADIIANHPVASLSGPPARILPGGPEGAAAGTRPDRDVASAPPVELEGNERPDEPAAIAAGTDRDEGGALAEQENGTSGSARVAAAGEGSPAPRPASLRLDSEIQSSNGAGAPRPADRAPGDAALPDTVKTDVGHRGAATPNVGEPVQTVATRIILRPPPHPDRFAGLPQALEMRPGIVRAEIETNSAEVGTVLLTHDARSSPLGALLSISDLDFRLVALEDGSLEIEIIE